MLKNLRNHRTILQCNQCYQNPFSQHFLWGAGGGRDFKLILSIWASFTDYVGKGEIYTSEE